MSARVQSLMKQSKKLSSKGLLKANSLYNVRTRRRRVISLEAFKESVDGISDDPSVSFYHLRYHKSTFVDGTSTGVVRW